LTAWVVKNPKKFPVFFLPAKVPRSAQKLANPRTGDSGQQNNHHFGADNADYRLSPA